MKKNSNESKTLVGLGRLAYLGTYIDAATYAYTTTSTSTYLLIMKCKYTHIHTETHTHIHTQTHIYIHILIQIRLSIPIHTHLLRTVIANFDVERIGRAKTPTQQIDTMKMNI